MDRYWMMNGKDYGADQGIDRQRRTASILQDATVAPAHVPVVYFALAVGANLIKIGTVVGAHRVEKRMELLQPGCPFDLKVLLIAPGFGRREEARIHRAFAGQWHRGEWFRCEGRLKEVLQLACIEGADAACARLRAELS